MGVSRVLRKRMDRISNLPDEIVCQILSFLSTKEAALTSLLSKRWRDLFAFTSNLCFEDNHQKPSVDNTRNFTDFVDRVLAVSGNFPIKKFTLKSPSVESAYIKRWICNVMKNDVMDLYITLLSVPSEIFTCKTLVKLKLGKKFIISFVPKTASLPALKTLFIESIRYSEPGGFRFKAPVSACPVLEELTIPYDQPRWRCTVSSMTLKRLTINSYQTGFETNDSGGITFDTPSLAYLDYSGFIEETQFSINLDSVVKANLTLRYSTWLDAKSNPTNLIKGLRNVVFLNITSLNTSTILYAFGVELPVFEKLSRLSIATKLGGCWKVVPLLLKRSPNLETLVIKGPLHYYWGQKSKSVCRCLARYSFLESCPVKVLEITKYRGTQGELAQMEQFLKKLQCLELIKVHACAKEKFHHKRSANDDASQSSQDSAQVLSLLTNASNN